MVSKAIQCGFKSHPGHVALRLHHGADRAVKNVRPGCQPCGMHDKRTRIRAMALLAQGQSLLAVSNATGIARSTLRDWRDHPGKLDPWAMRACPRCSLDRSTVEPQGDYAYLLGLYLGDGCISRQGNRRKD